MATLVGDQIIFPKGSQTSVEMSQSNPGPFPCPSGDMIAPFAAFPAPQAGDARWYRLKAVYYDENAGGSFNVQIIFTPFDGSSAITFNLPQVNSGQGASNFHYSDWFKSGTVYTNYGTFTALFNAAGAVYDNHAGVFSLVLEAHDLPQSAA